MYNLQNLSDITTCQYTMSHFLVQDGQNQSMFFSDHSSVYFAHGQQNHTLQPPQFGQSHATLTSLLSFGSSGRTLLHCLQLKTSELSGEAVTGSTTGVAADVTGSRPESGSGDLSRIKMLYHNLLDLLSALSHFPGHLLCHLLHLK